MGIHTPDGNSARNTENKKRPHGRNQSFQELVHFLYFSDSLIYFLLHIEIEYRVTRCQQTWQADPCQNQVLHTNVYKGLRSITSSSGHEAFWHFMALSSDNGQSTRKLILPGVNFLKPGATLRRHQIKLHSYRAKVQGATIEKGIYLAWGLTWLILKVNTYFSYMLVVFINVYNGRGYGDLAANIGPVNEKPFTNIIPNQPTILH